MILDYGDKQEEIPISKDLPEIIIRPDLVLHMPNGKKILVEVANPRDPKRFIGEIIYPKILLYHKKITAALVFVLDPEEQETQRSLSQILVLDKFLRMPKGSRVVSWPGEDAAYNILKAFITTIQCWKH
jgi:uncharacterized protein YlzI (FlbEa/FlbD family)